MNNSFALADRLSGLTAIGVTPPPDAAKAAALIDALDVDLPASTARAAILADGAAGRLGVKDVVTRAAKVAEAELIAQQTAQVCQDLRAQAERIGHGSLGANADDLIAQARPTFDQRVKTIIDEYVATGLDQFANDVTALTAGPTAAAAYSRLREADELLCRLVDALPFNSAIGVERWIDPDSFSGKYVTVDGFNRTSDDLDCARGLFENPDTRLGAIRSVDAPLTPCAPLVALVAAGFTLRLNTNSELGLAADRAAEMARKVSA